MTNAGTSRWFGGMGTSLDGVSIADDDINPNPAGGKQTFKFKTVAGAAVSFRDFNQFRLYYHASRIFIINQFMGSYEVNSHNGRIDEAPILVNCVKKFMRFLIIIVIIIYNESMA